MIQLFKIVLLVLGSVILQTALVARITIFGNKPDLPLMLILSVALLRGPVYGELVGFASGLLGDAFSGGPLGLQAFSKVLIGYFAGFVRSRFYYDNPITQFICGLAATVAYKLITSVHLALFVDPGFLNIRFEGLAIVAVVNSVLAIGVFRVTKRVIKVDA